MTGGIGREEIRAFYAEWFTPQMPQDSESDLVSRTVRSNTGVDEYVFKGTHSRIMHFFASIAPTGKRIEVRACQVTEMAGDKAKAQRHYFDMATLLQQLGVGG